MTGLKWMGILGLASLGAACAHLQTDGSVQGGPSLESFLPLSVGNQWIYATTFQGQAQPDLTVAIVQEQGGYFIDNRPTPSRMRFDAEGLRDGSVRYLLQGPLTVGHKWMSVADVKTVERYEIVAVGREVRVPAGVFKDCVTVRLEVRIDDSHAMYNEMTFAPGAGIVEIRTDLKAGAKLLPQAHWVLKNFQVNPKRS